MDSLEEEEIEEIEDFKTEFGARTPAQENFIKLIPPK